MVAIEAAAAVVVPQTRKVGTPVQGRQTVRSAVETGRRIRMSEIAAVAMRQKATAAIVAAVHRRETAAIVAGR